MRGYAAAVCLAILLLSPRGAGNAGQEDGFTYVLATEQPSIGALQDAADRAGAYPRFLAVVPLPGIRGGVQALTFGLENTGLEDFDGTFHLRVAEIRLEHAVPQTVPARDGILRGAFVSFRLPDTSPADVTVEMWWEVNGARVGEVWTRAVRVREEAPCAGALQLLDSGGDKGVLTGVELPRYALLFCNGTASSARASFQLFDSASGRPIAHATTYATFGAGAVFGEDPLPHVDVGADRYAIVRFQFEEASPPIDIEPYASVAWSTGATEVRHGLDPVTFALAPDLLGP